MTIEVIIEKYLKDNGFDGLCDPALECGCGLDDFMPCGGEGVIDCQPAYKHVCMPELKKKLYLEGECPLDCCGECYRLDKPEAK